MADKKFTSAKRARASKPKVRSGCITCKIRRVKCDEAKPACGKCVATGRKCDGYGSKTGEHHQMIDAIMVPSLSSLQVRQPGNGLEMRAVEHFRLQTAPALSFFHNSSFWSHIVLQTGFYEPAVLHAAAAVSLFHEQYQTTGTALELSQAHEGSGIEKGSLALQQYNKAINCLIRRASDDPDSRVFILIACLLFVCVEFLRGNEATAIEHIQSGLNILSKYRSPGPNETSDMSQVPHFIDSNLVPIFSRLNLLAMLFGSKSSSYFLPGSSSDRHQEPPPSSFSSMTMARDSMMKLLNANLNFIHIHIRERYEPKINQEALDEQAQLQDQFAQWLKAFDVFERNYRFSFQNLEHREAIQLRMLHKTTLIWLSVCMLPEECAFDSFVREFKSIVSLASLLKPLDSGPYQDEQELPKFSFEMGTLTPLYFTAVKCRDPDVRRNALTRLLHTHRREGLWDSHNMAIVAARVIALEEQGIQDDNPFHVPERARIHNVDICSPRRNKHVVCVTFMTKPGGVYDDITFRREQLDPQSEQLGSEPSVMEFITRKASPIDQPLIPKPGAVNNLRCNIYECAFLKDG